MADQQKEQIAEALRELIERCGAVLTQMGNKQMVEALTHEKTTIRKWIQPTIDAALAILEQQETPSPERRALENVYMLAKLWRRKGADIEAWDHIIRFCAEGGCKSSILREQETPSPERPEPLLPEDEQSGYVFGEQIERTPSPERWRVGRSVPLNVYEGNTPVCQCHSSETAHRIVDAMNALPSPERTPCLCRKALEAIQWDNSDYELCPMCDQPKWRGHSPDCLVGAALASPCSCDSRK